jgi:hypothetical protein
MRIRLVTTVLSLLLAALPGQGAAQRDRSAVGAQLGYARTWIETSDEATNAFLEGRQGAFVGLFYRRRVQSWVALQAEINFTTKGGAVDLTDDPTPVEGRSLEVGFLEVPLLLRLATPYRPNRLRPVAFAGASVGFRIGCSVRTDFANDSIALSDCTGVVDQRSVEPSWVAGGGIQWERKGVSLALEARFTQAITSTSEESVNDPRNQLLAILFVLTL